MRAHLCSSQFCRSGVACGFLKRQKSALFPPSPPGGSIATFIKYHVDLVTEVIQAETGIGQKPKLSAGKSAAGSLGDHVAKLKERW